MGNADAWLISGIETADEGIPPERLRKMGEIRNWSLSQLTEDDQAFISNFQPTVTLQLEEGLDLLCFHGSPTSFDDVILPAAPEEEFQKFLGKAMLLLFDLVAGFMALGIYSGFSMAP